MLKLVVVLIVINTQEVGFIRILKSHRISDGILRLYYVAGSKTIEKLNYDTTIINEVCNLWNIPKTQNRRNRLQIFQRFQKTLR